MKKLKYYPNPKHKEIHENTAVIHASDGDFIERYPNALKSVCGMNLGHLSNKYAGQMHIKTSKGFIVFIAITTHMPMNEWETMFDCHKCLEILRRRLFYCPLHGYIHPKNVTFDEKCAYCGNPV